MKMLTVAALAAAASVFAAMSFSTDDARAQSAREVKATQAKIAALEKRVKSLEAMVRNLSKQVARNAPTAPRQGNTSGAAINRSLQQTAPRQQSAGATREMQNVNRRIVGVERRLAKMESAAKNPGPTQGKAPASGLEARVAKIEQAITVSSSKVTIRRSLEVRGSLTQTGGDATFNAGTLALTGVRTDIKSAGPLKMEGAIAEMSGAQVTLKGGLIKLGSNASKPVARIGDSAIGAPAAVISSGSRSVLVP